MAVTRSLSLSSKKHHTLDFEGNDRPGKGGDNEDSASVDISAVTTPYVQLRADNDHGDKIDERDGLNNGSATDEVVDDKLDEGHTNNKTGLVASPRDLLLEEYRTELGNGDVENVALQSE